MRLCSIELGGEDTLRELYSWPNLPGAADTLAETVLHWFAQTLARDGIRDVVPAMRTDGAACFLDLDGTAGAAEVCAVYAARLPAFLANGRQALETVLPAIRAAGRWNPDPTLAGDVWRFFLPLGLPLARQKSLQFFHYPPLRLLDPMRDYLDDPVPVRWEELLRANGVARGEEARYECVMDATPIAAPDDQGSKKSARGDPQWGLIPIQDFTDYQKAQVRLLLNAAPGAPGFTIPLVVYGAHPRAIFNLDFAPAQPVGVNVATQAAIVPGRRTPVAGANHPYMFYAVAQGGDSVGSGRIADGVSRAQLAALMVKDLAVARWQVALAADPGQDPAAAMRACLAYWNDPSRAATVAALVEHQGSLYYPDPQALQFTFKRPCPDLP